MTAISDIIRDAFRESNLIPIGANPSTAEQAEGLRLLNRFILSLFGNEAGEQFISLPLGGRNIERPSGFPYYGQTLPTDCVPPQAQLILNLNSAATVYLDPRPGDGQRFAFIDKSANLGTYNLTVDANGYTIDDLTSETFSTNSDAREYFFRADTGNWSVTSPLDTTDESPFPVKFDDLLIIGLAIRLNPRNGVALDQQSLSAFASYLRKFRAQYRQERFINSELALLRTLNRGRRFSYDFGYDDSAFNFGKPGAY